MTVEQLMKTLKISEEEARQVIADDLSIERGEKLFELTEEQKKVEKKMRATKSRTVKNAYGKSHKVEKKTDVDKSRLMKIIETAISDNSNVTNFEMVRAEGECIFNYNGRKFKIILSAPRT